MSLVKNDYYSPRQHTKCSTACDRRAENPHLVSRLLHAGDLREATCLTKDS